MNVEKVLQGGDSEVVSVQPDQTVLQVARLFEQKRKGLVVVCNADGRIAGVVSLGDVVHAIGERGAEALNLPVRMIMTLDVTVCEPVDEISSALDKMRQLGIRHLPVVRDGKPVGLIEGRRALEVLYEEAALDFSQLRNYVFKTGGRY
jgi:CBS domain-containing protein